MRAMRTQAASHRQLVCLVEGMGGSFNHHINLVQDQRGFAQEGREQDQAIVYG